MGSERLVQGECKGTVPCLGGSEREQIIPGSRWMMSLELEHVCFIILPAGTSLGLCFMSSMCLGFWRGWGFSGVGQGGFGRCLGFEFDIFFNCLS